MREIGAGGILIGVDPATIASKILKPTQRETSPSFMHSKVNTLQ
jgi:hypothetical protein